MADISCAGAQRFFDLLIIQDGNASVPMSDFMAAINGTDYPMSLVPDGFLTMANLRAATMEDVVASGIDISTISQTSQLLVYSLINISGQNLQYNVRFSPENQNMIKLAPITSWAKELRADGGFAMCVGTTGNPPVPNGTLTLGNTNYYEGEGIKASIYSANLNPTDNIGFAISDSAGNVINSSVVVGNNSPANITISNLSKLQLVSGENKLKCVAWAYDQNGNFLNDTYTLSMYGGSGSAGDLKILNLDADGYVASNPLKLGIENAPPMSPAVVRITGSDFTSNGTFSNRTLRPMPTKDAGTSSIDVDFSTLVNIAASNYSLGVTSESGINIPSLNVPLHTFMLSINNKVALDTTGVSLINDLSYVEIRGSGTRKNKTFNLVLEVYDLVSETPYKTKSYTATTDSNGVFTLPINLVADLDTKRAWGLRVSTMDHYNVAVSTSVLYAKPMEVALGEDGMVTTFRASQNLEYGTGASRTQLSRFISDPRALIKIGSNSWTLVNLDVGHSIDGYTTALIYHFHSAKFWGDALVSVVDWGAQCASTIQFNNESYRAYDIVNTVKSLMTPKVLNGNLIDNFASVASLDDEKTITDRCSNLISLPQWLPPTITHLTFMVAGCDKFNDSKILNWDTSNVLSTRGFAFAAPSFNQKFDVWNLRKCVDFSYMVCRATAFNQNISALTTESGVIFVGMFKGIPNLTLNLNDWNLLEARYFAWMFSKIPNLTLDWSNLAYDATGVIDFSGISNGNVALSFIFLGSTLVNSHIDNWQFTGVEYSGLSNILHDVSLKNSSINNWKLLNCALAGARSYTSSIALGGVATSLTVSDNSSLDGWELTNCVGIYVFSASVSDTQPAASPHTANGWKVTNTTVELLGGSNTFDPQMNDWVVVNKSKPSRAAYLQLKRAPSEGVSFSFAYNAPRSTKFTRVNLASWDNSQNDEADRLSVS